MINLIPPEGHKTVRNEYLLRVGTVYCFLFSGVFLSITALLLPVNVLLDSQLTSLSLGTKAGKDAEAQYTNADHVIRNANATIAQLKIVSDTTLASTIIEEVRKDAVSGITFNTFQTSRDNGTLNTLEVQGVAKTRTTLASFKDTLEHEPNIASAEVPISDLARDTDLPFAIKVVFKK